MMVSASKRVLGLGAYAFAEVDAIVARLRSDGVDLIDFGVGDPTVPTPPAIREACARGIEERCASGYPAYVGGLEYRQAVARWMRARFDVDFDPQGEITATMGSKEAIFHVHEGFVDPGDIVICPSPGYPPYARGAAFSEGQVFFYPLVEDNDFLPDLEAIPTAVARRAKIFWLCQPHVPSGRVVPAQKLDEIVAFCREFAILLCSDEAYSEIYFEAPPRSVLQHGRSRVLAFFSLSKRSAMTGYRCGWVAGDREAVAIFRKVKTNIDSGTPTFIQDAAVAALADETHVEGMRENYRAKGDILASALHDLGLPRSRPQAGLYIWQRVPPGSTGLDVARHLWQPDTAVITTPGAWLADPLADGFNPGEPFIRLALVPPMSRIEEATRRLREVGLDALRP